MRGLRSNRRCLCERCHIRNDVVSLFLLTRKEIHMGDRSGSNGNLKTGGNSIARSNKIKSEMFQYGMNSKFKGVQRDAQSGRIKKHHPLRAAT